MQDEKRIRLRVVSVMTEPDGTRHENQSVHRGTLRAAAEGPEIVYEQVDEGVRARISLTRTAAGDLGPSGITVNMVSGGLLRTTDASAATPDAVFDLIAGMTPLRSVTTPQEFADAVLFFASPWSRAVTGQNLVVDGGLVRD